MGLGVLAVNAQRVSDAMFMAAAKCLSDISPPAAATPVTELRSVSFAVTKAVAMQAIKDGVAGPLHEDTLESRIRSKVWDPVCGSRPCRNMYGIILTLLLRFAENARWLWITSGTWDTTDEARSRVRNSVPADSARANPPADARAGFCMAPA